MRKRSPIFHSTVDYDLIKRLLKVNLTSRCLEGNWRRELLSKRSWMRYCKGNREWTLPPPPQPPACTKRYEIVPRGVKTEDKQAGLWILSV